MHALTRPAGAACTVALALAGAGATTASASDHESVDQTQLVPTTLDSSFAPFDCTLKVTGPVCTGERYIHTGWEAADFPCEVPIYGRYISYRHQIRYYDLDYLNYDRRFRTAAAHRTEPRPRRSPLTCDSPSRSRSAGTTPRSP